MSPEREILKETPMYPLLQLHPEDYDFIDETLRHILLASGRGYTRYIEKPLSVRKLPDGLIELRAKGFIWVVPAQASPDWEGEWRLIINPNEDYLVRRADFVRDGEVVLRYTTRGVLQGSYRVALKGAQVWDPEDTSAEERFWKQMTFRSFQIGFSADFFEQAKLTIESPAKGTYILDFRSEPVRDSTVK